MWPGLPFPGFFPVERLWVRQREKMAKISRAWRGHMRSGLTWAVQSLEGPQVTCSIGSPRGAWHLPALNTDIRDGERRAWILSRLWPKVFTLR